MSGYTPLFNSLTRGSLCGQWPDIGLWAVVLSLSDRNGVVDMHPNAIAALTGLPADDVVACMARFCQPDAASRSKDADGARLVLIDPERDWGWRIVNHGKYREKARKAAYDAARTASGADAERKRAGRSSRPAKSREVPRSPDSSRSTNTNVNTNVREDTTAASRPTREQVFDLNFEEFKAAYPKRAGSQPWNRARKAIKARGKEGHPIAEIIAGAKRYAAYCEATGKSGTEYVMQAATFCGPDKPFMQLWDPPATKADIRLSSNLEAAAEAKRRIFG